MRRSGIKRLPRMLPSSWSGKLRQERHVFSQAIQQGQPSSVGAAWPRRKNRFNAVLAILMASAAVAVSSPSPMADAAEKSNRAAIRALLKQHADVNAPQVDGMTALHWAVYQD